MTEECPTDFEFAQYTRGELDAKQAAAVASHIAGCPTCKSATDTIHAGEDTRVRASPRKAQKAATDEAELQDAHRVDQARQADAVEPSGDATLTAESPFPTGAVAQSRMGLGRFGDYELLGEIARGGMGVVYKARQINANRVVALKMILSGNLASQKDIQRFYIEAEAAANLEHPNIVPVHDVGEQDGQHYYSMGFVDGESLAARVRDGPLESREAAELIKAVGEGVAYAHHRGIVHRDLKPGNVLIDAKTGQPKITDFGLARNVQDDSGLTATGQVLGTPNFMPPEQARGDVAGPLADVYSLGATLYRVLTGRPPFLAARPMDTLKQVLNEEPVPPTQINSAIDKDLETICLKCLQKELAKRYASADELVADLAHWLDGEPITARPVGRVERTWRWCQRNPLVASLAATAVTFLLMGTVASASLAYVAIERAKTAISEERRANKEAAVAVRERKRADVERDEAKRQKKDAQILRDNAERRLYIRLLDSAKREWEADNVRQAWTHLNDCSEDLRGWEYRYLHALFTRHHQALKGHPATITSLAFSPDGSRIVSGSFDRTLKLWDAGTGEEILTIRGHAYTVDCAAFSPDGNRIVSGGSREKTLKLWDAGTGEEILAIPAQGVKCVAFSPDGNRIVSGNGGRTLKLWDASTGEEILTLTAGYDHRAGCVAFSPDGSRIVSGSTVDSALKLWDAATGKEVMTLKGHIVRTRVTCVAFSPDGSRIASGSGDKTLKLWDTSTGEETLTLRGHTGGVSGVAFIRDGSRIVSGGGDGTIRLWDTSTGEEILTLRGHVGMRTYAFSPASIRVVSGGSDGTLKLWDVGTDEEGLTFKGVPLAVNPDGSRIVVMRSNGTLTSNTIEVRDARTGEKRLTLEGNGGYIRCLAYNPAGNRIIACDGARTLVWDATTGDLMLTRAGHSDAVAFSPDGSRVVSASQGKPLVLWDFSTGEELVTLRSPISGNRCVAFSPNGRLIVSGNADKTLMLWDAITGEEVVPLTGHTEGINCVAFSPDGNRIVSGGNYDKTLKLWDISTGEVTRTLEGHSSGVNHVAFSPDGSRIVSSGKKLRVWDAVTGEQTLALEGGGPLLFMPDGSCIVTPRVFWDASGDSGFSRWRRAVGSALRDGAANHKHLAALGEKTNDWYAAAFHLGWLMALEPNEPYLQERRATAESKLRQRGLAIPEVPSELAALNACGFTYTGILESPPVSDEQRILVEMLARNEEQEPDSRVTYHIRSLLGASCYVNGQFAVAVEQLTKFVESRGDHGATELLLLALVHHGLQQLEPAREFYDQAIQRLQYRAANAVQRKLVERAMIAIEELSAENAKLRIAGLPMTVRLNRAIALLKTRRESLGEEHPETVSSMRSLAEVYLDANQPDNALPLYGRCIATRRAATDPLFSQLLMDVSADLLLHHQDSVAEKYLRECLTLREKELTLQNTQRPNLRPLSETKYMLGGVLLGQQKMSEAEPLLIDGYEGMNQEGRVPLSHYVLKNKVILPWVPAANEKCPPSEKIGEQTVVFFQNQSTNDVCLIWIDFEGQRVPFDRLVPKESRTQRTYSGHTWLVADVARNKLGRIIAGEELGHFIASDEHAWAIVKDRPEQP